MPLFRLFRRKKPISSVTWERTPSVQQVYYDEDGRRHRGDAPYLLPKDDLEAMIGFIAQIRRLFPKNRERDEVISTVSYWRLRLISIITEHIE